MSDVYLCRMRVSIFFVLIFSTISLQGQDSIYLPFFEIPVHIVPFGEEESDVLLFNMHDNENTSAMAGRVFGEKYAGSYYELMHTGKRNISFLQGKDSIHIDPNRIFTDTGIWLQLKKNKLKDSLMFQTIVTWRDSLLSELKIEDRRLVIALHNNTAYNYGFKSYMPGEEYADEAQAISRGSIWDKDDFFFVTEKDQYDKLAIGKYSVVLQSTETLTDDGSLSVYCGQLGIPYINVEAQHGHLPRQIKMLIFAYRELVENNPTDGKLHKDKRTLKREIKQLIKASRTYFPGCMAMASTICSMSFRAKGIKTPD